MNVNMKEKLIAMNQFFFLRFEPREYRLTRVPCWCKRFSYTIKMSGHKTTSRFRKVIQLNGINYSSMNFYNATINYVSSIDVLDPISGNKTVPLEDVYRVDIFKVLERRNWNNYTRLFAEYEVR